jgi:hypothetical protein
LQKGAQHRPPDPAKPVDEYAHGFAFLFTSQSTPRKAVQWPPVRIFVPVTIARLDLIA